VEHKSLLLLLLSSLSSY